jgi:DnaJ-class molecular chaperone
VKQSDSAASAIAREHFKSADIRTRYRLAAVGESWKIVGIDHECLLCRGTGESGASRCQKCNGEGWYEPQRDSA